VNLEGLGAKTNWLAVNRQSQSSCDCDWQFPPKSCCFFYQITWSERCSKYTSIWNLSYGLWRHLVWQNVTVASKEPVAPIFWGSIFLRSVGNFLPDYTMSSQKVVIFIFVVVRTSNHALCVASTLYGISKRLEPNLEYFVLQHDSHVTYCNGFAQSVSRQRLCKHVSTCRNGNCASVDECYSSLLGSSQRANGLAR
jgi:hypothetical protein